MSYVATSGHVSPTQPGTYYWVASYGGNANNITTHGNCGDTNESVTLYGLSPASSVLPKGAACQLYGLSFSTGVPGYTYAVSGTPPGLSFHGDGTLSGQPSAAGTYILRVTASGPGLPTLVKTYSLTVGLCIEGGDSTLPGGTHGHAVFVHP